MTVLAPELWRARRAAHEARVDAWTRPALERASRSEAHPVEDFLFTYDAHRPAQLRRWSPGPGVVLVRAPVEPPFVGGDGGAVLPPPSDKVRATAARTADLLARTAARAPSFGCFGMHEWAMVHGTGQAEVRHAAYPLRLGAAATSAVVESLPVRCTHFDAFRFFTPSARPLNLLQPTRETQADLEQPGCLHAGMDLYRAAYLLSPHVEAELVADAFALAREVRLLDVRASPYDLSALGHAPVRVETPEGRAEYVAAQRAFAEQAAPLRRRVLDAARALV